MTDANAITATSYSMLFEGDFTVLAGIVVFFMQVGFINLEVGQARAKNVKNILLKNMVNVLLAVLCWWSVGYAFAYGTGAASGFIGKSSFFQDQGTARLKPWFFSWTFAVSTASIVSGCLAERTALFVYPATTILLVSWVHPLVVHWVWSVDGWLSKMSSCGYLDFAGSSVVHCVGGLAGLAGAYFVGPRIGRFEEGEVKSIPGHDITSMAVGTFMLWFGWFGFNTGSVYTYDRSGNGAHTAEIVDRVALNMTLTGASAGLTSLLVAYRFTKSSDLGAACNGLLMGLVAATGSCAYVPSWGAFIIGLLAGLLYSPLSNLLLRLKIDDPLDSAVIHLGGGMLGVLLNGAFAKTSYVTAVTGKQQCGGFLLNRSNGGLQLGMQLLGLVAICGWTAIWCCVLFYVLKRLVGSLRVDQATELAGIDNIEHGGPAYPEFNMRQLAGEY